MSQQSDVSLANQGFADFRSELNLILAALNSSHSGSSRPASAVAGTFWLDTTSATAPILKHYDGTDDITCMTFNYTANTVDMSDSAFDLINDTTPQLGGALDGQDNTVSQINLKDYGTITSALGSVSGATTLDLSTANHFTLTIGGTTTLSFTNPTASDELCGFVVNITNGASSTLNFPSSVDWPSATAPTLSTSGTDTLVFWTYDGGTNYKGALVGAAFA